MLKKIVLIFSALSIALGVSSCLDVSLDNKSDKYIFAVVNGTGGELASIVIGSHSCVDVAAGDSCVAQLNFRPATQTFTYTGKQPRGYGEKVTGTVTETTVEGSTAHSYTLVLDSTLAAVHANNTSGNEINLTGIKGSGGAVTDISGFDSYSNYYGEPEETLNYTDMSTAVTGTLTNQNVGDVKLYATVTGEQITHDVTDEVVASTWTDPNVVASATLANAGGTLADLKQILKKSVQVKLDDGTPIAVDDGNGTLTGERLKEGDGLNTINYATGAIQVTSVDGDNFGGQGITTTYRYITLTGYGAAVTPIAGTVVIRMGDTVVAAETWVDEPYMDVANPKYVFFGEWFGSTGETFYDHSGAELDVLYLSSVDAITMDKMTDHLMIEYKYEIGTASGAGPDNVAGTGLAGTVDMTTGAYTINITASAFENIGGTGYNHTFRTVTAAYEYPHEAYGNSSFIGFFKISDLLNNYFYLMQLNGEPTGANYVTASQGFLYNDNNSDNSYGSNVVNLIWGP